MTFKEKLTQVHEDLSKYAEYESGMTFMVFAVKNMFEKDTFLNVQGDVEGILHILKYVVQHEQLRPLIEKTFENLIEEKTKQLTAVDEIIKKAINNSKN